MQVWQSSVCVGGCEKGVDREKHHNSSSHGTLYMSLSSSGNFIDILSPQITVSPRRDDV